MTTGRSNGHNNGQSDNVPPPPSMQGRRHYHLADPPSFTLRDSMEGTSFPADAQLPIDPAARIAEACIFHGDETALEILDQILMRYHCRNMPIDQIARRLDVDVKTARDWMKRFKARMKKQLDALESTDVMMKSMGIVDSLQTTMLNKLDDPNATFADKCRAFDRVIRSDLYKMRMLEYNQYFKRRQYAPKEQEDFKPKQEAVYLQNMIDNFLMGRDMEDDLLFQDLNDDLKDEG